MKILDRNAYPLSINSDSKLLFFRKGNLYLYDLLDSGFTCLIAEMPDYANRLLSQSRLFERILRNCPGPGISLGSNAFLYHYRSRIYRIDLAENKVYEELRLSHPKKVLYFTKKKCIDTGRESIYFGEYFENKLKDPVNIWRRDEDGQWGIYSTFPANCIEHVHNITVDARCKRLLILTGDFGESCGIWSLEYLGQVPVRLVGGSQMYRAAWMYADESRLVYATDTPFEQNYLIELNLNTPDLKLRKLHPIAGSSIYGGAFQNGVLFFSTSVEPVALSGNYLIDILQTKRGLGISDNKSYLYRYVLATNVLEIILSDEKDALPMRLGQYGSFVLSNVLTDKSRLLVYGLALRNFDDMLLELQIDAI